ncbi:MAG: hypothetical protein FWF44_02220 [Defluviitaleaceae bacterium]|nr:hypothetical protein [Defluviitaleaceae bacterium]
MSGKSVFNLDEKIAGLLCYALGWATGIFFLIAERNNRFVRFHALQSTIWFGALSILTFVFGRILKHIWIIGGIFGFLSWLVGIICVVSWLVLMFMAFRGAEFKIPVLGDAVAEHVNK